MIPEPWPRKQDAWTGSSNMDRAPAERVKTSFLVSTSTTKGLLSLTLRNNNRNKEF
ncbi:hypothetical protein L798_14936 [Zootermopsis nevadensis]|uniref:Uncharacterized protein n=1 Tax=Zootermopsis nevadensis TaxID=136037 RepID=A0A067QNP7_ZOONE|nr:hypothetical protein L798_14936 [Zootermopsis nevadensis]